MRAYAAAEGQGNGTNQKSQQHWCEQEGGRVACSGEKGDGEGDSDDDINNWKKYGSGGRHIHKKIHGCLLHAATGQLVPEGLRGHVRAVKSVDEEQRLAHAASST